MATEESSGRKNTREKGGKKSILGVCILSAALLVAICVIGVLIYRMNHDQKLTPDTPPSNARGVVISQENADEIADEMSTRTPTAPGYYTVAMTSGWHFENSGAVSKDAYVKNKEENSHNVYFDLFLADDRTDPIYMSPVISLGAELNEVKLSRDLPKGEYDCVMVYHLVDEDQNTVDTLEVTQRVIIEN